LWDSHIPDKALDQFALAGLGYLEDFELSFREVLPWSRDAALWG
jgi:hypothetical protein